MLTPTNRSRSPGRGYLCHFLVLAWAAQVGLSTSPTQDPGPAEVGLTRIGVTDHFEFHSDPWINLHHFLYQWSRAQEGIGTGRHKVEVPERQSMAALTSAQRHDWEVALDFYRKAVAARDHFDRDMLQLKRELLRLGGDPKASPPDAIEGIAKALTLAMPVYQAKWWPRHDQANRAWTAAVTPLLQRHESRYIEMTVRTYGAHWPEGRRRVDVSAYANFRAAYTAFGHIVVYSTDPGNQGLYALETLLHEVQHTREVGGPGREELFKAFQAVGLEPPQNLWHALIFATAGEFVRSVAVEEGLPEHTPYWIREGFKGFQGWHEVVPVVLESWPPVVRGETTRGDAYSKFTQAFAN